MIERKSASDVPQEDGATDEEIWLLGQPYLRDYLHFVKDAVVGGAHADPAALTDEWRAANDYYEELERREAGIANQVECRDLDPGLVPLAAEVSAHPHFRHSFNTLPTSFAMVELDKLIVFQKSVTGSFVRTVQERLGPAPDPAALFRFCLPIASPDPAVEIRRVGSRRFSFRSDSMDLRYHEPALLQPPQLRDYETFGPIAGVVGLVVGFGSNFLNAIRVGKRLLLHNGYHRACALRALGITHAPCIVQTVTRPDELAITAKATVMEDPAFYFKTARPPLLKDFFDPKIGKRFKVHKQVRMIEVNFEVKDYVVRA